MVKTCRTCRQHKEDGEFSGDKSKKDKLGSRCKDCDQEYQQANWADRIVRSSKLHDDDADRPIDSDDYIDSKWVEELVGRNPNCHYCDAPLKYGLGINRNTNPDGLQLDRMDSSLEHTKSNCVQCCKTCNHRSGTIAYKWKKISGGSNFAHFGMKWCPYYLHNGGDEGDHVRNIDEFGLKASKKDGLCSTCRSCTRQMQNMYYEEQRASKKLKAN